jgi:Rrf2 family iron-sulfur cluster assembly transcriptional regulator
MQITRAAEYAIRGLLDLCSQPEGSVCLLSEVSERQNIPASFLSKIFQNLSKAGMVSSSRGTGGGFVLAMDPRDISLLDVLEAIEGRVSLNVCVNNGTICENMPTCAVHPVWCEAQEHLVQLLGNRNFAELAKANRKLSEKNL